MSRATEIYSREFDSVLFQLPPRVRELIEEKIHDVGSRLERYPHHRLKGRSEFRLRVGDYRIIYEFDRPTNNLHLLALGPTRSLPMTEKMRTLGIIGGTGPETTIEYYRRLIAAYRAGSPEGRAPSLVINSIDSKKLIDLVTANELTQMTEYLTGEVERLARAGAGLALLAANTPHLVFDEVESRSSIPMLSIVTATRDAAGAAGLRRLALFGTRFTMQAAFFPEIFKGREMAIVVPNETEQTYIHDKYMSELFVNIILPETRERLLEIVQAMKEREGVDGLILGGTELSLILREPTAAGLPVLDTTQIHVEAAVEWLLRD